MWILLLWMCLTRVDGSSFAVIGDWGRGGAYHQREIGMLLQRQNVSFVISTGDNFYPSGISSTYDENVLQWEDVYRPRVPWYLVLGNHDYRGDVDAQVELTHVYENWNMPRRFYDAVLGDAHFFFIDTTPWVSRVDVDVQVKWLTRVMGSSNALKKYVVGHHPLWTCGYHHERDDVSALRSVLIPLLQKTGAVYLSGHDHNLQHIVKEGVQTFISGAGAYTYDIHKCDGLVWGTGKEPGFLLVEGSTYTFMNRNGPMYTAHL